MNKSCFECPLYGKLASTVKILPTWWAIRIKAGIKHICSRRHHPSYSWRPQFSRVPRWLPDRVSLPRFHYEMVDYCSEWSSQQSRSAGDQDPAIARSTTFDLSVHDVRRTLGRRVNWTGPLQDHPGTWSDRPYVRHRSPYQRFLAWLFERSKCLMSWRWGSQSRYPCWIDSIPIPKCLSLGTEGYSRARCQLEAQSLAPRG